MRSLWASTASPWAGAWCTVCCVLPGCVLHDIVPQGLIHISDREKGTLQYPHWLSLRSSCLALPPSAHDTHSGANPFSEVTLDKDGVVEAAGQLLEVRLQAEQDGKGAPAEDEEEKGAKKGSRGGAGQKGVQAKGKKGGKGGSGGTSAAKAAAAALKKRLAFVEEHRCVARAVRVWVGGRAVCQLLCVEHATCMADHLGTHGDGACHAGLP